jgi:hypothetical protein
VWHESPISNRLPCLVVFERMEIRQSRWLNPIEPKWVHGKRAVVEPNGVLSAKQLAERICAYYHCSYEAHLSVPEKVS